MCHNRFRYCDSRHQLGPYGCGTQTKWAIISRMSSRNLYKRALRIRIAVGLLLVAGIVAILVIAATYTPN